MERHGELGHGDTQEQELPKKTESLARERIVAVLAGYQCSFAIATDGAVWSWGLGRHGQLGHGDEQDQLLPKTIEAFAGRRVISVSAKCASHSLALTADGALWSWGCGNNGQLGHSGQWQHQSQASGVRQWPPVR